MTTADLINLPGVTLGPTVAEGMAKLQAKTKAKTPTVAETLPPIPPPRMRIILDLPGVIVKSEANIGGKMRAKMARKSAVKEAVRMAMPPRFPMNCWQWPVRVKMIRVGGKKLDDDNLDNAFKAVRDVVAEWLQVDDGDHTRVRFTCRQEPGWKAGIRVEIG